MLNWKDTACPWPVRRGIRRSPQQSRERSLALRVSEVISHQASCACGGGCPRCIGTAVSIAPASDTLEQDAKRTADAAMRGDPVALDRLRAAAFLPTLRLHSDDASARAAAAFGAAAFTIGTDVFFGARSLAPHTLAGQHLIAHELTHVAQQASGAPRRIQREATGSPLEGETADERARRQRLLRAIDHARDKLLQLLSSRGLMERAEVATERGGVPGVLYFAGSGNEVFASYTTRDRRIRRIVRSLMSMAIEYRSAPIPAAFGPPVRRPPGEDFAYASSPHRYEEGGQTFVSTYSGSTAAWADLQSAYERYRVAHGQVGPTFEQDWLYLDPDRRIIPGGARQAPRISHGINIGIYLVVPDIEREPLHYWRLTGFEHTPRGSVIVELWQDTFGYFYWYHERRIDVPDPWAR